MIPVATLLGFPGQFFMNKVPALLASTFPCTEESYLSYNMSSGAYNFHFNGAEYKSGSIEELIEIAVCEIEKAIAAKIAENTDQCPYITLPLTCDPEQGPEIDICDSFAVLERPWRVEFYTDTFRRGIESLRNYK